MGIEVDFLNQERKDERMGRILWKGNFLNQERKDERMDRILLILKSFFSWFKTTFPFLPQKTSILISNYRSKY